MNAALRFRIAAATSILACSIIVGCGGGGGGGGSAPITNPIPVATATQTPTPAPMSQATSVPLSSTGGSVLLGSVTNSAGAPAISTGSVIINGGVLSGPTTLGVTMSATLPTGLVAPQVRSVKAKPQTSLCLTACTLTPLAYFAMTFSPSVTISYSPHFTVLFPSNVSLTTGNAYLVAFSSAIGPNWVEVAGPTLVVPGGPGALDFPSTAINPPLTMQAAPVVYYFAIVTTGSAVMSTPTPTPSPTPTPIPPTAPPGTVGVSFDAALNNIARASLISPLKGGELVALSQAADQIAVKSFLSTSLTIGSGTSAQVRAALPFNAPAVQKAPFVAPVEDRPADSDQAVRMARALPRVQPGVSRHQMTSTIPLNPTVGTTANIWVAYFTIGSSAATYTQLPATLEAQTPHGNVWIDNTLLTDANAPFGVSQVTASANQVGADFENGYASDTTHFGTPDYPANFAGQGTVNACTSAGATTGLTTPFWITEPADKRTNVMVVNSNHLGNGVGGYFSAINYVTQAALNCFNTSSASYSNEAPLIYVGYFDTGSSNYELGEDLVRSTAHEFQHLINFVNNALINNSSKAEDRSLNEGLSMLAQDLAVPRMYPALTHDSLDAVWHAAAYLQYPQNYSVSGFIGIDQAAYGGNGSSASFNCGGGCYGSEFMFMRYMYDRCGGDAFAQSMEASGKIGWANLQASCGATTETGNQLLNDFAMALAVNQIGMTPPSPAYNLGTLSVKGSYASNIGGYPAQVLPGLGSFQLSANSSGIATAPVGGFAFFSLSGDAGLGLSITDSIPGNGFSLLGGVAQY